MSGNKEQSNSPLFWSREHSSQYQTFVWGLFISVPIFGIALGYYYSSLPKNNPQRDKKSCESIYGEWLNEEGRFLLSYKKAGETCVDGGQCKSGICFPPDLTEEQKTILLSESIENIIGTCYPDDFVTGCVKQVVGGTISKNSMCQNH